MTIERSETAYRCVRCGKRVSYESIAGMPEFKCPHCGYRVLQKVRPPIVKRIKAL